MAADNLEHLFDQRGQNGRRARGFLNFGNRSFRGHLPEVVGWAGVAVVSTNVILSETRFFVTQFIIPEIRTHFGRADAICRYTIGSRFVKERAWNESRSKIASPDGSAVGHIMAMRIVSGVLA